MLSSSQSGVYGFCTGQRARCLKDHRLLVSHWDHILECHPFHPGALLDSAHESPPVRQTHIAVNLAVACTIPAACIVAPFLSPLVSNALH